MDEVWAIVAKAIEQFQPKESINYFSAAGYDQDYIESALDFPLTSAKPFSGQLKLRHGNDFQAMLLGKVALAGMGWDCKKAL